MQFITTAAALALTLSRAAAQDGYKGFNSGATFSTGAAKQQVDFAAEMRAAQQLPGTDGSWTSVRLFTTIQGGTTSSPISAIPAAIETNSTLLLGLWASVPADAFQNEIAALTAAVAQYGAAFTDRVAGISVGSEDLYRAQTGDVGAPAAQIVDYISQVRAAIAGTALDGKPVGHVDTWNAYTNGAHAAVFPALDFVGMDAYPYYQSYMDNSIATANATFWAAYDATVGVAQGKPVWITETGWPVSGDTLGAAVPGAENAGEYWGGAVCSAVGRGVNFWYFQLQSVQGAPVSPDWGVKGVGDVVQVPTRFGVSC